jgi:hypothetical protein
MAIPSFKLTSLVLAAIAGLLLLASPGAYAVPSYARQTGQQCVACHVSFPELTPYGRYFKLTGYTIGQRQTLPFAVMGQVGMTKTKNNTGVVGVDPDTGDNITGDVNPRNGGVVFSGGSVFLAGKATDNIGGFVQWTYNPLAADPNTNEFKGHGQLDNTDIRITGKYIGAGGQEPELIYGATLHNNPTVQDVWNSTPAFGFPYTSSPLAQTPAVSTLIDGGLAQQVAGLGGYFFWKKTIYGELSYYRTADGVFSALRAGQDTATPGGVSRLSGYNPYWRLAYNREWGSHSMMVGTYGMMVNKLPDNTIPGTPTDKFTDTALDAQYQYITDPHTFTAQATYIHEKQNWDASFASVQQTGEGIGAGATPSVASTHLNTVKAKATYYYLRKYGATLAYVSTTGSPDAGLYGAQTASPDSTAYVMELNYLPIQNVRLMLQYTNYTKFNGASSNYDGNGRNAKDNNTLFLNAWFAF